MKDYYVAGLIKNTPTVFAQVIAMPDDYDWKKDARAQHSAFPVLRNKISEIQQGALYASTRTLWGEPNNIIVLSCQPL